MRIRIDSTPLADAEERDERSRGRLMPVLDQCQPLGSIDRLAFSTAKPCEPTVNSHISHVAADSGVELLIARVLDDGTTVSSRTPRTTASSSRSPTATSVVDFGIAPISSFGQAVRCV